MRWRWRRLFFLLQLRAPWWAFGVPRIIFCAIFLPRHEIPLVARPAAAASRGTTGRATQTLPAAGPMPAQSRTRRTGRDRKVSAAAPQATRRPVPVARHEQEQVGELLEARQQKLFDR